MPKFSVVIPTRNRETFLREAIESVLRQDEPDFELIIINDGDAEVTVALDPRIQVHTSGARGAVPARNLGITAAKGKYLAWLDDDDQWIAPDHLSTAARTMAHQPALFFADGLMQFPGEATPRHFSKDAAAKTLQHDNTILISAVCYPRAWHDALGMFDESLPYYWDWDWYLRVAQAGHHLHRRAQPVVDIRLHPANMSGGANTRARQENLDLLIQKHRLGRITLKNHADFASQE